MSGKNPHPNTAKIDLDFPITVSGVEVAHLVMRRPKLRDDLAAAKSSGSDEDKAIQLVANLCEVAPEDLMELDSADWAKLEQQVQDFRQARR
jgi:uncharacterized protein (DUF885 family)